MKQLLTITALLFALNLHAQHYQTASTGIVTDTKMKMQNFFVNYGEGLQFKGWQVQADGYITMSAGSLAISAGYDFGSIEVNAGVTDILELVPKYEHSRKVKIQHTFAPIFQAKIKVLEHWGINVNYTDGTIMAGIYFKGFLN